MYRKVVMTILTVFVGKVGEFRDWLDIMSVFGESFLGYENDTKIS